MKVVDLFEHALDGLVEGWDDFNPALLTFQEYQEVVNPDGKGHPEDAYDWDLEKANRTPLSDRKDLKLIQTISRKGIEFKIYLGKEKRTYLKKTDDIDNPIARDENGLAIRLTDNEIEEKGYQKYEYTIYIKDDKGMLVGGAQDEWGAVLIWVVKEYRKFGLGRILSALYRKIYPSKGSGGFTPSGLEASFRYYQDRVGEALTDGTYRKLVDSGEMSMERFRKIVRSANLPRAKKKPNTNEYRNEPVDWLLYWNGVNNFILYNK